MNFLTHILANGPTEATFFLPKGNSNLAVDVDWAWDIIFWTCTVFFFIVNGAMMFFVIKYRRRTPNDKTSEITHNTPLEIVWTVIPLIIVIGFFYVGFKGFANYDNPQSNSSIVRVDAKKWQFTFTYENGGLSENLYCVINKPVRLNMYSDDVLHALYLPTFRTQRNLIPGRQTSIWFIPTELSPDDTGHDLGGFPIYCTQYCGDGHSRMRARVYVLTQERFDEKMKELANPFKKKVEGKNVYVPYNELGEKLYRQFGCNSCHSVDGKAGTGPTWLGLWKRQHEFSFTNVPGYELGPNDTDEKWETYIHESILKPEAKLVKFEGKAYSGMPPQTSLSGGADKDEMRRAIIAYIKDLDKKYDSKLTKEDYNADNPKFKDANGNAVHPESLSGIKARSGAASAPGGGQ